MYVYTRMYFYAQTHATQSLRFPEERTLVEWAHAQQMAALQQGLQQRGVLQQSTDTHHMLAPCHNLDFATSGLLVPTMLQGVAGCCGELRCGVVAHFQLSKTRAAECVAVCCRVLPCDAVCCRVLVMHTLDFEINGLLVSSMLQCVVVCCSVLPYVAVCCCCTLATSQYTGCWY